MLRCFSSSSFVVVAVEEEVAFDYYFFLLLCSSKDAISFRKPFHFTLFFERWRKNKLYRNVDADVSTRGGGAKRIEREKEEDILYIL